MTTPSYSYQELLQHQMQWASVLLTPDIYDWYQKMQKDHTVWYDTARDSWLVFHYDDVQQVLLDPTRFSSQRTFNPDGSIDPVVSLGMIGTDPPHHRQLRALVSAAFTPHIIAMLEPRITQIVHMLLDRVQEQGEMDVVDDLAFPLPIIVISELLGVPSENRAQFRQWTNDLVGSDFTQQLAASQKIAGYFQKLIEQRRQELRDDLISELIRAEIEGERLPDSEILGTCVLILSAGHETTTGLISNAVVCLDEFPEAKRDLIDHLELLPLAIEEVLRYRAVLHTVPRVVAHDTVFAGHEIKAGNLLLPLFASANFDEKQFPNAGIFDIRRTPNRHLGFGYGIHFCLGAPLARLETRIALRAILERFPTFQRRRDIQLELKPSSFVYGLKHLPINLR